MLLSSNRETTEGVMITGNSGQQSLVVETKVDDSPSTDYFSAQNTIE